MPATYPSRKPAAIIGFGDAYCRQGEFRTALDMSMQAMRAAIDDAGVDRTDIDGLLTGRSPLSDGRPQWNNVLAAYAKLTPRYSTEVTTHAAGMLGMVRHAAMAVRSGAARMVLCVGADAVAGLGSAKHDAAQVDLDPEFERPYGPLLPAMYAQIASRLFHEDGMNEHHLAAVSVQSQEWAVHHPFAAKASKGRITMEDVLASPMVASPLRLWNCATWGPPGTAGAVLVTSGDVARSSMTPPLYLAGAGECHTHEYLTDRLSLLESSHALGILPNITHGGAMSAGQQAYREAGMKPQDIGIVQTASNFSHMVLMSLAELGFTSLRDAGEFVLAGATGPSGEVPANTNGGWLSFGQPGVSCVMDSLIESVRQLRGQALGLQVNRAATALVHAAGGTNACHSVLLLTRES
jgi:acetyl-CoA acetyltransferase